MDLRNEKDFEALPAGDNEPVGNLNEAVEDLEKRMILKAMKQANGIQRRASKLLGVSERILGYKLKRYHLN